MSTTTKKEYQFETKHKIPSCEELKKLTIIDQYPQISIRFNVYDYNSKKLVFYMILDVIGVYTNCEEIEYDLEDIFVSKYKGNVDTETIEAVLQNFREKKHFIEFTLQETILESYIDFFYDNITLFLVNYSLLENS